MDKTVAGTALIPRLDAWSSGGTVFKQAFSSSPSTSAGRMTLFTSTWPAEHRVTFASEIAPRWVSMLTETFADNGYVIGAITENAMLAARSGFARGFDTYKENRGIANWGSAGEAEATIRDGVRWLENHKDDVFYLFLHTYEVHGPYAPPEDLRSARKKAASLPPEARNTSSSVAKIWLKLRKSTTSRATRANRPTLQVIPSCRKWRRR